MLHKFATFVAGCTVLLLFAGSLVTSTGSGLAVPDWPTTYGWNMFTFPPSKWVGGILYEHGHRLIASSVGLLTIVLAAWMCLAEQRRWLRRLAVAAVGTVIAQGILGGLTVLFFLPAAISTAHAGLAEIFFCLTVAMALFTSPRWIAGYGRGVDQPGVDDDGLRGLATISTALIYVQILVGATVRHTGAGLAIPDFPLMFGQLVPDRWSPQIAIHFAHRLGALVVVLGVIATAARVLARHRNRPELMRPATFIIALLVAQVTLGAYTIWSRRDVWINSLHVVCGAMILTTSLVLTLRCWRMKFAVGAVPASADAALPLIRGAQAGVQGISRTGANA